MSFSDPLKDETEQNSTVRNLELFYLIFYTIEMAFKIFGLGFIFNKNSYLRDYWNILDFIIVGTGYIPYILGSSSGVNLTSLRILRVLRPLRTINTIKALKILLNAFFASLPMLLEILTIFIFVLLVFGIAGL